jgi:type III restriction enzyme
MKLHFEPNLEYQQQAIEAVCDLFRGQEICRTEFTVTADRQRAFSEYEQGPGIGNKLSLLDDEIFKNLHDIQLRNGLPASPALASGDFTVEMETGTGKTYVYLRTIFELNKRYGFTKFVIVVPSVAIREGVYKALQITEDHFRSLYAGVHLDYFIYDSDRLGEVRSFATSPHVQVMVTTIGAINKKDVNNLYKVNEKTGGEQPIDLIRSTCPIVIVDEPQSVDGGPYGEGRKALARMKPMCTLRYSATHLDKHHMVYRLDAVDAYEMKLVKQIEVASATVEYAYNKPFVRVIGVSSRRGTVSAVVEVDVKKAGDSVERRTTVVFDGDDLAQTTGRDVYADCRIGEIRAQKGNEYVEVRHPGGEMYLRLGEAWGDIDPLAIQRQMIRRTIREHLEKELRLRPKGIKVLSLFFIDEVAKYRSYDASGQVKGSYATIFEEEYRRMSKLPEFNSLFKEVDFSHEAEEVHDGYFSIDRNGGWSNTSDSTQPGRDNAERAYNLIMKEKERLLAFETPLKFIFSHSALREGWDNPNVFQICTLRDIRTERERRQTIGRGLRLCVDQNGNRVRGFETNTLTVVASESYEDFAENLQKEIEEDTGFQFGVIESHSFAGLAVAGENGEIKPLGFDRSAQLWEQMKKKGLIDSHGRVQELLKKELLEGSFEVPEEFIAQKSQIEQVLRKSTGRLEIKNADERRTVALRKEIYLSPDFSELWNRIKHKTTYRVHFDNELLVAECARALRVSDPIPRTRLQWRKADLAIGKAGIEATEQEGASTVTIEEGDIVLPDILTELQDRTQLTRKSICRILMESGRIGDFQRNPQQFIDLASERINAAKRLAIVNGIQYRRIGDSEFYAQELLQSTELTGYLRNLLDAHKCVYEKVVYDSGVESDFAKRMELEASVKLYVKLPGWFKIPTPLGSYNPDWAVLLEEEGEDRLYFVVETKGTVLVEEGLRNTELAKINCGRAHFQALDTAMRFVVADTFETFSKHVLNK